MNARWTVVVLLGFLVGCDSTTTMGGNVLAGVGGHAGAASTGAGGQGGGKAGGAGGAASCDDVYVSYGETLKNWQGTWLIDDATRNPSCPNSLTLQFERYGTYPFVASNDPPPMPPKDPEAGDACPPPAEFHVIVPAAFKDCNSGGYCPTFTGGYGFWLHAMPKAQLGKPLWLSEQLWINSNGHWEQTGIQGEHIEVREGNNVNTLTYFGFNYQRTDLPTGLCKN